MDQTLEQAKQTPTQKTMTKHSTHTHIYIYIYIYIYYNGYIINKYIIHTHNTNYIIITGVHTLLGLYREEVSLERHNTNET